MYTRARTGTYPLTRVRVHVHTYTPACTHAHTKWTMIESIPFKWRL